jgi:hypothetical protein
MVILYTAGGILPTPPLKDGWAQIDNRWVVPYNSYLTRRYKAHINVEIRSSIKILKYLYKYIYKGLECLPLGPNPYVSWR